ncbi:FtsX-like permease family protein [Corynebacterium auriscanis]|uniref:FtsX-like permease family protein n=1 Tax=Corynebacterium auriscanis TaxID=99807 RepID=UPI003CE9F6CE
MFKLAVAQLIRRPLRYVSLFLAGFIAVALTIATLSLVSAIRYSVENLYSAPYENASAVAIVKGAKAPEVDKIATYVKRVGGEYAFDRRLPALFRAHQSGLYEPTQVQTFPEAKGLRWRGVVEGRLPSSNDEVAISQNQISPGTLNPIRVGDSILLQLRTQVGTRKQSLSPQKVRVVGLLEADANEQFYGARSIFASNQLVSKLGAAGQPNFGEMRINFSGQSVPDMVAALRNQSTETIEIKSADEHAQFLANQYLGDRKHYFVLLDAFVVVIAVIAGLVIFSSYQVLMSQRIKEYALLRAIGATDGGLTLSALLESCVLGLVSSTLGVPFGLWLTRVARTNAQLLDVKLPLDHIQENRSAFVFVVVGAVIVTLAAAVPSVNRTLRLSVVTSLRQNSGPTMSKTVTWEIILAGGMVSTIGLIGLRYVVDDAELGIVSAKRVSVAICCGVIFVLGVTAVTALVLPVMTRTIGRILKYPTLQLPLRYAGVQSLRTAALVAIIFSSAALVGAIYSGQDKVSSILNGRAEKLRVPDLTINSLDGDLQPRLVESLTQNPGVSAAAISYRTQIGPSAVARQSEPPGKAVEVEAVDPTAFGQVLGADAQAQLKNKLLLGLQGELRGRVVEGQKQPVTVNGVEIVVDVMYINSDVSFVDKTLLENHNALGTEKGQQLLLSLKWDRSLTVGVPPAPVDQLRSVEKQISSVGGSYTMHTGFIAKQDLRNTVARVTSVALVLVAISLIISVSGCLNTINLAMYERRGDRRLLHSLGIRRSSIILQGVLEILLLGIPVVAFGLAIGSYAGVQISNTLGTF